MSRKRFQPLALMKPVYESGWSSSVASVQSQDFTRPQIVPSTIINRVIGPSNPSGVLALPNTERNSIPSIGGHGELTRFVKTSIRFSGNLKKTNRRIFHTRSNDVLERIGSPFGFSTSVASMGVVWLFKVFLPLPPTVQHERYADFIFSIFIRVVNP